MKKINEVVVIGAVLVIQGGGSALAKAVWNTNWGLLALAERWVPVPAWAGAAVAVVGLVVGLVGWRMRGSRPA